MHIIIYGTTELCGDRLLSMESRSVCVGASGRGHLRPKRERRLILGVGGRVSQDSYLS